jgi:hypothetical protein
MASMNNIRIVQLDGEDGPPRVSGKFVGRWEDEDGQTQETEPAETPREIEAKLDELRIALVGGC